MKSVVFIFHAQHQRYKMQAEARKNVKLIEGNVNEPGSNGFVRYRIKPLSTLVAVDQIKNNAAIYFDFNQPVMTDTAVTEIELPTGMKEGAAGSSSKQLIVYPNPARDELFINSYSLTGKNAEVRIYDLFERVVFQSAIKNPTRSAFIGKSEIKINVSGFSQGIYFVELPSGEQVLRGKFLKD